MKLYVVRHGQTDANVTGAIQCYNNDIDLNEKGILQAKETAVLCKNLNIDLIISSPMKRAVHTADIINQLLDVEIILDDRLMERNTGILGGKILDPKEKELIWDYNVNQSYEGAESIDDVFKRVDLFIKELINKYGNTDENILLASHGGVTKTLCCLFDKIPEDGNLNNVGQTNCEVKEYIIENYINYEVTSNEINEYSKK